MALGNRMNKKSLSIFALFVALVIVASEIPGSYGGWVSSSEAIELLETLPGIIKVPDTDRIDVLNARDLLVNGEIHRAHKSAVLLSARIHNAKAFLISAENKVPVKMELEDDFVCNAVPNKVTYYEIRKTYLWEGDCINVSGADVFLWIKEIGAGTFSVHGKVSNKFEWYEINRSSNERFVLIYRAQYK